MKITVLNGSPKGNVSVTMQYIYLLQRKFPQHELKILNIAQRIRRIENDAQAFRKITDEVKSSDGVLWAFPLYVFLVHSGYKRFIELISEKKAGDCFRNKHAAILTTSIHFFDHTARNYVQAICDDLDMQYVGAFTADMRDFFEATKREMLKVFFEDFLKYIEEQRPVSKSYAPLQKNDFNYAPGKTNGAVCQGDKRIVILTDCEQRYGNLDKMIKRFRRSFERDTELINLHEVEIKGPCLGCLRCGFDYKCAYTGKDGFIEFFNSKLKTADILVFAGMVKDRYLSSKWKQFLDRAFFNTHTPVLSGKQMAFLVSGPLAQIPNLREIFQAYVEWQQSNLVDFVTDESGDSAQIDALLQGLAERLVRFTERNYIPPKTFLGTAGMKIFRDNIWGRLRFVFQADHNFYKKHGVYDFPQKDLKGRLLNTFLIPLTKIPRIRREVPKKFKDQMVSRSQKMLDKDLV
jgi:multimeric flavodoxin WrbA